MSLDSDVLLARINEKIRDCERHFEPRHGPGHDTTDLDEVRRRLWTLQEIKVMIESYTTIPLGG